MLRRAPCAFPLFDGKCQCDQPPGALRQADVVYRNAVRIGALLDVDERRDQARVPFTEIAGIEFDTVAESCPNDAADRGPDRDRAGPRRAPSRRSRDTLSEPDGVVSQTIVAVDIRKRFRGYLIVYSFPVYSGSRFILSRFILSAADSFPAYSF